MAKWAARKQKSRAENGAETQKSRKTRAKRQAGKARCQFVGDLPKIITEKRVIREPQTGKPRGHWMGSGFIDKV